MNLKVIGFRHHVPDKEESLLMEYPQILTNKLGINYIVPLVIMIDVNNPFLTFGGKPRRLYVHENEHPLIFKRLEEVVNIDNEEIIIPGRIVKVQTEPYSIGDKIYNYRSVAIICNDQTNSLEYNLALAKAVKYQGERQ